MLFLLPSSSSSLLLLLSSSSSFYYYYYYYYYHYYYYYYYYYYHHHHYYYYYYYYCYYYYYYYYCHYPVNNIPYQCDITCAGHFTLDALASRTVACFSRVVRWRQGIKGEMTCTGYVALVWNIIYRIMTIIVTVVAHGVALPLYRDCFLDLRLFNSPDLRRLVLCYCCQSWTLETVLGGNTALPRWWTARSIDADAKR